jgi:DNA ligase-1
VGDGVRRSPDWLFDECHHSVGDLAETIALLLPANDGSAPPDVALHVWVTERLLPLATMTEDEQRSAVLSAWRDLSGTERYVWNKLITGAFASACRRSSSRVRSRRRAAWRRVSSRTG